MTLENIDSYLYFGLVIIIVICDIYDIWKTYKYK